MTKAPHRALRGLLAIDLTGVLAIATIAKTLHTTARTSAERRDGAMVAAAAGVGFAAWIPAAVAVAHVNTHPQSRHARALVWGGLVLNTIGSVTVGIMGYRLLGPASAPVRIAIALGVGGGALSGGYLRSLSKASHASSRR